MVRLFFALVILLLASPGWAAKFELASPALKPKGKIGNWLQRRERVSRAALDERAERYEELRRHGLRSRRADRKWLVALGHL